MLNDARIRIKLRHAAAGFYTCRVLTNPRISSTLILCTIARRLRRVLSIRNARSNASISRRTLASPGDTFQGLASASSRRWRVGRIIEWIRDSAPASVSSALATSGSSARRLHDGVAVEAQHAAVPEGNARSAQCLKRSGICDVSEWAIKLWLKAGNLNKAKAANAQRFARAAGESIENFLVLPDE